MGSRLSDKINVFFDKLKFLTLLFWYDNKGYAYYRMGRSLEIVNKFKRSLFYFRKAIKYGFTCEDLYMRQGYCHDQLENPYEAISSYTQAIKLNPNNGKAYYNRGMQYYFIKKDKEAESDYLKNIELDPNDAKPYIGLGYLYYLDKRFDLAKEYYRNGIKLDKDNEAYLPEDLIL